MANTLTAGLWYNPYFYANAALDVLYKRLGLAFYVNREIERDKASGKGDTVQVRRPQSFVAANMPISEASTADVTPDYDNLQITKWQGNQFKLTDKERSLTPAEFISDHIEPAAISVADAIDQDLASLSLEVPWIVSATASPNQTDDFANIRQTMFNNKCPLVNPNEYAYMTDGVLQNRYEKAANFVLAQNAGDTSLQRDGQLGVKFGFRIFPNQNATTFAGGSATGGATVTGVQTKGATSLTVATITGTLKRGTVVTIAGDPQLYAIKADVTAGTSYTISPALAKTTAGGEAITYTQTAATSIGLAFHRNAFALVNQPLADPGPGIVSSTVVDRVSKLAVRLRVWGSGGAASTFWALDCLWGFKALNPNLAVRVQI